MENTLMENPTIKEIITFVETAMKHKLKILTNKTGNGYSFIIENINDKYESIIFRIYDTEIYIQTEVAMTYYNNSITERERASVETLYIDVKEYNHDRAINYFNNFFVKDISIPKGIDDLEEDEL